MNDVAIGDRRPAAITAERSLRLAGSLVKGRYRLNAVASISRDVVVYTAEDVRSGRSIALKILRDEFAADAQFVAAVRDQARTLARSAHVLRGVARVYEFDALDTGEPFVALEWTEGTSVRDVLDACGALAPSTALRVAIRVGEALEALHHNRILHGRLGPDSVLMAKDGDGVERVKLVSVELTAAYRTPRGVGVPDAFPQAYRAPEQTERGETTEATDVYALGMLLRELLTAGPPEGATGIRTATPPLSPAIERIITIALAEQPERRYADITEMVNDMWGATTALAEPEARGRPVKPRAKSRRRQRLRRGRFILHAMAAAFTAGIVAVSVWSVVFGRVVARVRERITPPAITAAPVDRGAPPTPAQAVPTAPPGEPSSVATAREETSTLPRAVQEASTEKGPAPAVAGPLPRPVVVRQRPVAAPAVRQPSRPAVESRTLPASPARAEPPARVAPADTEVGDGSAAIDWLLKNRR